MMKLDFDDFFGRFFCRATECISRSHMGRSSRVAS